MISERGVHSQASLFTASPTSTFLYFPLSVIGTLSLRVQVHIIYVPFRFQTYLTHLRILPYFSI